MLASIDTMSDLLHSWKETKTRLFVRRWRWHLVWLMNQVEVSISLVITQRANFSVFCTRDDFLKQRQILRLEVEDKEGDKKSLSAPMPGVLTLFKPGRLSNRVCPALTLCLTPLMVPFLLSMFTLLVVKVQSLVAPAYRSRSSGSPSLSSSSEPRGPSPCPWRSPLVDGVLARSASELLVQSESTESEGPSSLNISFSTRPLLPEATRKRTRFCGLSVGAVASIASHQPPRYMVRSSALWPLCLSSRRQTCGAGRRFVLRGLQPRLILAVWTHLKTTESP